MSYNLKINPTSKTDESQTQEIINGIIPYSERATTETDETNVTAEHRKWKSMRSKKTVKALKDNSYWQTVSACNIL